MRNNTPSPFLKNSAFTTLQIAISSLSVFILYRLIYKTVGVEGLGLWSIVLSFMSFLNYSSLGLPGGLVKFIAKRMANNERDSCSVLIQTSILMMAVAGLAGVAVIYPSLRFLLPRISQSDPGLLLELLNWGTVAFGIQMIYNAYASIFDGFNQIYKRNIIAIAAEIVNFTATVALLNDHGIASLVYGKVIQHSFLLIISILAIRTFFPELPFIPRKFDRLALKEILGYSINFQVWSIAATAIEPLTRTILSFFGGDALVGYYEMAQKLAKQLRALIAGGLQTLFPMVATLTETDPHKIPLLFQKTMHLLIICAIPLFVFMSITAPAISMLWLGEINTSFTIVLSITSIAYGFSALNIPAQLTAFGEGRMRDIQISTIATLLLVSFLGWLSGIIAGGIGAITAIGFSIAIASNTLTITYHLRNNIKFTHFTSKKPLLLYSALTATSIYSILFQPDRQSVYFLVAATALPSLLYALFSYQLIKSNFRAKTA